MKTFETEFAKLANWIRQKNDEYVEKKKKEIGKPITKGHDSKLSYKYSQDVREYGRRLTALKKKYGITGQNDAVRGQNTIRDNSTYASGK